MDLHYILTSTLLAFFLLLYRFFYILTYCLSFNVLILMKFQFIVFLLWLALLVLYLTKQLPNPRSGSFSPAFKSFTVDALVEIDYVLSIFIYVCLLAVSGLSCKTKDL